LVEGVVPHLVDGPGCVESVDPVVELLRVRKPLLHRARGLID
jgi:hypothetical protein